jgi:beta-glucanase (GH16 family)
MATGLLGCAMRSFLIWLSICCASFARADEPKCPLAGHQFAWGDEFDGDKVDVARWDYRTGVRFWSEQRPENVSLRAGRLVIAGRKEKTAKVGYTAGGVISKQLFRYGYYEARFKVPPGAGWHTSFWMMRNGWRNVEADQHVQEIDVCENDSVRQDEYSVNSHQWLPKPHKAFGGKKVKTPSLSADFHVWGCEFTAQTLKYYFDGKLVHQADATVLKHGDQHVWLTMIASPLGGTKAVDDAKLPAEAEYDYVRVFTRK